MCDYYIVLIHVIQGNFLLVIHGALDSGKLTLWLNVVLMQVTFKSSMVLQTVESWLCDYYRTTCSDSSMVLQTLQNGHYEIVYSTSAG